MMNYNNDEFIIIEIEKIRYKNSMYLSWSRHSGV